MTLLDPRYFSIFCAALTGILASGITKNSAKDAVQRAHEIAAEATRELRKDGEH